MPIMFSRSNCNAQNSVRVFVDKTTNIDKIIFDMDYSNHGGKHDEISKD